MGTDDVVLDPNGFPIRNGGMYEWATEPDVAFNGTNYLVVWREQDNTAQQWVYVRGVSPSGEVRRYARALLSRLPREAPRSRPGQQNSIVAWKGTAPELVSTPAWSTTAAHPLGSSFMRERRATRREVAFDGTNYLVAWSDADILGKRVAEDGTVLDAGPQSRSRPHRVVRRTPSAAFDGTNFVVAWEDDRYRKRRRVRRARRPLTEACSTAKGYRSQQARRAETAPELATRVARAGSGLIHRGEARSSSASSTTACRRLHRLHRHHRHRHRLRHLHPPPPPSTSASASAASTTTATSTTATTSTASPASGPLRRPEIARSAAWSREAEDSAEALRGGQGSPRPLQASRPRDRPEPETGRGQTSRLPGQTRCGAALAAAA